jgi:cytochrome P450
VTPRSALPPGPRLPAAVQFAGFWSRPHSFLERYRARYGKRFTIRLPATPPSVVMCDPEEVRVVFTAPADVVHPGHGARVLEPLLGRNSVILLDEAPHMEQRKLLLPAFHGDRVERLVGVMEEVAAADIAAMPRGTAVELHPLIQDLTLKVILRAVFGVDPGVRFDILRERLMGLLTFGDSPISMVPPNPGSLLARLLERTAPVVGVQPTHAQKDQVRNTVIAERRVAAEDRGDVLSMLLEAKHGDGSPMSDAELRDELVTMLVAGHETMSSTLAWIFAWLVHERAVLARLVEEIETGDETFLTAVIQEAMRLRPVVPNVTPRFTVKPIEVGDWSYPAGCSLLPSAYLIHHDPDVYPDPYSFRPERFLDEPPGTYTWIPFGGGRRRCVGASFALMEIKVVIATLLGSCDLRATTAGVEIAARRNITVRPARGARVVLADRPPVPLAG